MRFNLLGTCLCTPRTHEFQDATDEGHVPTTGSNAAGNKSARPQSPGSKAAAASKPGTNTPTTTAAPAGLPNKPSLTPLQRPNHKAPPVTTQAHQAGAPSTPTHRGSNSSSDDDNAFSILAGVDPSPCEPQTPTLAKGPAGLPQGKRSVIDALEELGITQSIQSFTQWHTNAAASLTGSKSKTDAFQQSQESLLSQLSLISSVNSGVPDTTHLMEDTITGTQVVPAGASQRVLADAMAISTMENMLNEKGSAVEDLGEGCDPSTVDMTSLAWKEVTLGKVIGLGSYGRVHVGWARGVKVAVKVIPHGISSSLEEMDAAEKEAVLSQQLLHPNLVHTYAIYRLPVSSKGNVQPRMRASTCELQTHLVMEYCNQGTLRAALDANIFICPFKKRPNVMQLVEVAIDIADALVYMHANDLVHRDLKSANVMLHRKSDDADEPLTVKVADFGLSKIVPSEGSVMNSRIGTLTHTAPELLQGAAAGKSADVYAFGVILWELFTCKHPYHNMRPFDVILAKSKHPTSTHLPLPPTCPTSYAQLCSDCWADVTARPSMDEVADRLVAMLPECSPYAQRRGFDIMGTSNSYSTLYRHSVGSSSKISLNLIGMIKPSPRASRSSQSSVYWYFHDPADGDGEGHPPTRDTTSSLPHPTTLSILNHTDSNQTGTDADWLHASRATLLLNSTSLGGSSTSSGPAPATSPSAMAWPGPGPGTSPRRSGLRRRSMDTNGLPTVRSVSRIGSLTAPTHQRSTEHIDSGSCADWLSLEGSTIANYPGARQPAVLPVDPSPTCSPTAGGEVAEAWPAAAHSQPPQQQQQAPQLNAAHRHCVHKYVRQLSSPAASTAFKEPKVYVRTFSHGTHERSGSGMGSNKWQYPKPLSIIPADRLSSLAASTSQDLLLSFLSGISEGSERASADDGMLSTSAMLSTCSSSTQDRGTAATQAGSQAGQTLSAEVVPEASKHVRRKLRRGASKLRLATGSPSLLQSGAESGGDHSRHSYSSQSSSGHSSHDGMGAGSEDGDMCGDAADRVRYLAVEASAAHAHAVPPVGHHWRRIRVKSASASSLSERVRAGLLGVNLGMPPHAQQLQREHQQVLPGGAAAGAPWEMRDVNLASLHTKQDSTKVSTHVKRQFLAGQADRLLVSKATGTPAASVHGTAAVPRHYWYSARVKSAPASSLSDRVRMSLLGTGTLGAARHAQQLQREHQQLQTECPQPQVEQQQAQQHVQPGGGTAEAAKQTLDASLTSHTRTGAGRCTQVERKLSATGQMEEGGIGKIGQGQRSQVEVGGGKYASGGTSKLPQESGLLGAGKLHQPSNSLAVQGAAGHAVQRQQQQPVPQSGSSSSSTMSGSRSAGEARGSGKAPASGASLGAGGATGHNKTPTAAATLTATVTATNAATTNASHTTTIATTVATTAASSSIGSMGRAGRSSTRKASDTSSRISSGTTTRKAGSASVHRTPSTASVASGRPSVSRTASSISGVLAPSGSMSRTASNNSSSVLAPSASMCRTASNNSSSVVAPSASMCRTASNNSSSVVAPSASMCRTASSISVSSMLDSSTSCLLDTSDRLQAGAPVLMRNSSSIRARSAGASQPGQQCSITSHAQRQIGTSGGTAAGGVAGGNGQRTSIGSAVATSQAAAQQPAALAVPAAAGHAAAQSTGAAITQPRRVLRTISARHRPAPCEDGELLPAKQAAQCRRSSVDVPRPAQVVMEAGERGQHVLCAGTSKGAAGHRAGGTAAGAGAGSGSGAGAGVTAFSVLELLTPQRNRQPEPCLHRNVLFGAALPPGEELPPKAAAPAAAATALEVPATAGAALGAPQAATQRGTLSVGPMSLASASLEPKASTKSYTSFMPWRVSRGSCTSITSSPSDHSSCPSSCRASKCSLDLMVTVSSIVGAERTGKDGAELQETQEAPVSTVATVHTDAGAVGAIMGGAAEPAPTPVHAAAAAAASATAGSGAVAAVTGMHSSAAAASAAFGDIWHLAAGGAGVDQGTRAVEGCAGGAAGRPGGGDSAAPSRPSVDLGVAARSWYAAGVAGPDAGATCTTALGCGSESGSGSGSGLEGGRGPGSLVRSSTLEHGSDGRRRGPPGLMVDTSFSFDRHKAGSKDSSSLSPATPSFLRGSIFGGIRT